VWLLGTTTVEHASEEGEHQHKEGQIVLCGTTPHGGPESVACPQRRVAQCYFRNREALASENARIWDTHYRPCPLNDHLADWEAQLEEYRVLVVEVQEIYEEHRGCGMG
jgi:hypothetical protein